MYGRFGLFVGAVWALAMVVPASASAGVTYGAIDAQGGHVWLKLRKDRKAIVSHEVEYYADCSDGDTWFGESFLGSEHGAPVRVRRNRFAAKAVENAYGGDVTVTYQISGRVTRTAITGRFTVNVAGSLGGSDFTCHAGPIRFNAVD